MIKKGGCGVPRYSRFVELTAILVMSVIIGVTNMAIAGTPAGTHIENHVMATYMDLSGVQQTVSSNMVYVTIDQVASVDVGPDINTVVQVIPGQYVHHQFVVTNTGNGSDEFTLSASLNTTGIDKNSVEVVFFADTNGNGVIDPGEVEVSATGGVSPGQMTNIIARVSVPGIADVGHEIRLQLAAVSDVDGQVSDASGTITFEIVEENVLHARLSVDQHEADPGDTLTYTVSLINQGLNDIEEINVRMTIPQNTSFVSNSVVINGEVRPEVHEQYSFEDVLPGQIVTLSYDVEINANASAGYISNEVHVTVADTSGDLHLKTNELRTIVRQISAVLIERNLYEPYEKEPIFIGQTYEFKYKVTNDGNAPDRIGVDAFITGGADAQVSWPVGVYGADGEIPLAKHNGRYTIGHVHAGGHVDIIVKVTVPVHVTTDAAGVWTLTTTVISSSNPLQSDEEQATLKDVRGAGATVEIVGDHNITGDPGEIVQFEIKVTNTGPATDHFNLTGTFGGYSNQFIYGAGHPISDITLGPGQSNIESINVRVMIPENALPNTVDGTVTVTSGNNSAMDASTHITIDVNEFVFITIGPDPSGAVNVGSYTSYPLQIINQGNTDQTVDIVIDDMDVPRLLRYQLSVSQSEGWFDDAISGILLDKGQARQVFVRVWADRVPHGWVDLARASIKLSDDDNIINSATITTTVSGDRMRLVLTADRTEAGPGEQVEYTIEATNLSAGPLEEIVLWEAIPEHTVFVDAPYVDGMGILYSTDGGESWMPTLAVDVTHVKWLMREPLNAGDSVVVTFRVEID